MIAGLAALVALAVAERGNAHRHWQRLVSDVDSKPFRVTLALTEALLCEARDAGAEHVLILVFPTKQQLERFRRHGRKSWRPLLDGMAARDVPFVDTSDWLKSAKQPVYGPGHFTRAGNAVIAEGVRRWLEERLD